MPIRLVAITHGDPRQAERCGRPLTQRATKEGDPIGLLGIYACPLHGDIKETTGDEAPFAYLEENDIRKRTSRE
jgi:hypothetical protein